MSTPTEEHGDLLIRNIWEHQTDCVLDESWCTIQHYRKPEAVLLSHESEKEKKYCTSNSAWTNAVVFLPLWFYAMECLEMKPR